MVKSPLAPIFLIVAVDVLGLTIMLPLLPFYSESLGATPFLIGVLISTYGLCQFISGPFLGQLSDRIGRKPVLLISQIGTLFGFVMMALSTSLPMLFFARILDGATAGNISVAQAYISDVTLPQDRTRAFGVIGASFGLGFLLGPAISGVLSQFGPTYPIWAAAVLSLTSIVATWLLLPAKPQLATQKAPTADLPSNRAKTGYRPIAQILKFYRMPLVKNLLLQYLTFSFAFSLFVSGVALFLSARFSWKGHAFGPQEVGSVFTYSGLINLSVQLFLLKWLARVLKERKLIVIGFLLMSLGYLMLSGVTTLPLLIFVLTFNNLGAAVLRPAITSEISQNVSREHQGAVLGVSQSLQSISQIIAPLIAGFLINRGWLGAWALAAGAVAMLGFLGAGRLLTRHTAETT